MIVKNVKDILEKSLESTLNLFDEIVLIDNISSDKTVEIAKSYKAKIYWYGSKSESKQKEYGLRKVMNDWVLVLDGDEVISEKLKQEIKKLEIEKLGASGFYIPYQNYYLGKPLKHGGESYKMLRLFQKEAVSVTPLTVHASFVLKKGRAGILKNKILHYSYRSIPQLLKKFTDYAIREARQKAYKGEKTSFRKIFLYPLHMFWARFIKDKGYKDGFFRIPLDLGFAYMEFLTYVSLWYLSIKSKLKNQNAK